jgi:hypothetical protein
MVIIIYVLLLLIVMWLGEKLLRWLLWRWVRHVRRQQQREVAPPAPGMTRVYITCPHVMAECDGPCYESWDPRACTCGDLWVDVPDPDIEQLPQKPRPTGGRLIRGDRLPGSN